MVGEAANGADCIKLLTKTKPDILLLDLRMPDKDGLAVLEEVNFDQLPTRVICVTAAEDDRDVVRAMRLGARGVVLKQSATDLLVKSIHRVHAGEIWLDNHMTAEVMKAFAKSSESGPRREKPLLSDREKEIVQLVAQGFRNKEIGEKLFISEQTVQKSPAEYFRQAGSIGPAGACAVRDSSPADRKSCKSIPLIGTAKLPPFAEISWRESLCRGCATSKNFLSMQRAIRYDELWN